VFLYWQDFHIDIETINGFDYSRENNTLVAKIILYESSDRKIGYKTIVNETKRDVHINMENVLYMVSKNA
jgi:hypothetical protein